MSSIKHRVLVIEDDKVDRMAFERFVKDENPPYDYAMIGSISEVKKILEFKRFDVVITDYMLGDGTAFDIFGLIKDTPIIIITGSGNEKVAVEAMKAGACDYLIKDPERNYFKVLPITVENAIKHKRVEERFELLSHSITSVKDSVYVTDMDDKIIFVNKAFCETYGYEEEDILGRSSHVLGEVGLKDEFYHKRKDGSEFPVSLSRSVIKDENGNEVAVVGVARDITERKRVEEALQEANERLKNWINELEQRNRETTLLNEMGDLLQTCVTAEEAYSVIAKSAHQLFSAESGALYMLNASEDLVEAVAGWGDALPGEDVFAPEECWALRRGHVYMINDPRSELLCKHLNHHPSGGYLCVPLMAQGRSLGMLYLQNENGLNGMKQSEEMWGHLKESTKQQLAVSMAEHIALALSNLKLRETLHNQAIRDSLTGLFNRRYMEESLNREVHRAERKGTPLGIIMLDLDHFKQFNDTFGHAAGDTLLHELGSFLQAHIRRADIACRYGGEEFMLILPETSLDDIRQRAEQLREEFKHLSVQYNGQSIKAVTLSLGVAVFPEHGLTAEAVSRAADLALYQAKREGRDRVVVGQPVVNSERLFQSAVISRQAM
ncbi:MAG: diguanylate cyclase [Ignavibacteriales bacterium]